MKINKSGVWGEIFAARYLRDNGYRIITGNFRSRLGEIDLIAQKGSYMCFVEVKTRGRDHIYEAKEAVDFSKQEKLIATSKLFMKAYPNSKQPRFDVCEVYLDERYKPMKINYIENAFSESD